MNPEDFCVYCDYKSVCDLKLKLTERGSCAYTRMEGFNVFRRVQENRLVIYLGKREHRGEEIGTLAAILNWSKRIRKQNEDRADVARRQSIKSEVSR